MVNTLFSVRRLLPQRVQILTCYVGEVIEGMEVVRDIEKMGAPNGAPKAEVVIANCGTL